MSQAIINTSLNIIKQANICVLTTIDKNGFPNSRGMLNLSNANQYPEIVPIIEKNKDELIVYFTTNTSSTKFKQINNCSKVSAYYSLPESWKGVMLQGDIEIVTDDEIKESIWQKDWNMYYPKGIKDPDYTVLRLNPSYIKIYNQFKISEYNFSG